jgi:hypothetical protein
VPTPLTADTITDDMIRALRAERRDELDASARTCDAALAGDRAARERVAAFVNRRDDANRARLEASVLARIRGR